MHRIKLSKTELINHFKQEEGYVHRAYKDHLGYWTIGIGKLLSKDTGANLSHIYWTDDMIHDQFWKDLEGALQDVLKLLPDFPNYHSQVQLALLDLSFQLGYNNLSKFKKTLNYIKTYQWNNAAYELLDSLYAKQTPGRANRNANRLRLPVTNPE